MSKIKNGGLDQYGAAEPFEQQQLRTAGIEGVNAQTGTPHIAKGRHGNTGRGTIATQSHVLPQACAIRRPHVMWSGGAARYGLGG